MSLSYINSLNSSKVKEFMKSFRLWYLYFFYIIDSQIFCFYKSLSPSSPSNLILFMNSFSGSLNILYTYKSLSVSFLSCLISFLIFLKVWGLYATSSPYFLLNNTFASFSASRSCLLFCLISLF